MPINYNHIVIDEARIEQTCHFCRTEEVPDAAGLWVGCDRCFAWFHVPCAPNYGDALAQQSQTSRSSRTRSGTRRSRSTRGNGVDSDNLWLCPGCRLSREREGDLNCKAIVTPVLKLINDLQLEFVDGTHNLAKELVKASSKVSCRDSEYKKIWKLGGEQNSPVNLLLSANIKCKLSLGRKKLPFFDFARFVSLELSGLEAEALSQLDYYLSHTFGALICRALNITSLKYLWEADPHKQAETAAEEETRTSRERQVTLFLREQASKIGREELDTHSVWKKVRRSLEGLIRCGTNTGLLSRIQSDMSGRPGIIDLRQGIADFMPEGFIMIARSSEAIAESQVTVGNVVYVAKGCFKDDENGGHALYYSIADGETPARGYRAVMYIRASAAEAVCDICYKNRHSEDAKIRFCCCSGSVCYVCQFQHAILLFSKKHPLACVVCRQPLPDTSACWRVAFDAHSFITILIALNPRSRELLESQGEEAVVIPDSDANISKSLAYDVLLNVHSGSNTTENDAMTRREVAALYRQQLNLSPELTDEEVMNRARRAAEPQGLLDTAQLPADLAAYLPVADAGGNGAGQSLPDVLDRIIADENMLSEGDISPIRSGPVSISDDGSPLQRSMYGSSVANDDEDRDVGSADDANDDEGRDVGTAGDAGGNSSPSYVTGDGSTAQALPSSGPSLLSSTSRGNGGSNLLLTSASGLLPTGGHATQQASVSSLGFDEEASGVINSGVTRNTSDHAVVGISSGSILHSNPHRANMPSVISSSTSTGDRGASRILSSSARSSPLHARLAPGGNLSNGNPTYMVGADQLEDATTPQPLRQSDAALEESGMVIQGEQQPARASNPSGTPPGAPNLNGTPPRAPNPNGSNPHGATIAGMTFTSTNRNNEAFWWESRLYAREGNESRIGVRYRCRGPGHCTSSCTLSVDRSQWVRRPSNHVPGCVADPHRQEISLAARRLQASARADENMTVLTALTTTGNNEYADTRDLRNLRERQSYTMRRSLQLPGLPTGPIGSRQFMVQSHENITQYGGQTLQGQAFVRFNDVDEGVAVFAADECIQRWREVDMLFIDCTFFVTPPGFSQTLTVTGAIGTQFIQLAYILLPDRQERTYRLALRELKRVVEQVNGSCDVVAVMTDFENALRNAITSVFLVQPQNLRGCLFHASKAWFSKLRAEGLAAVYRERVSEGEVHSPLNRWLHAIFGLPCLHPSEVTRVWNDLKLGQPLDQRAAVLVEYLDRYFMQPTSTWPPIYWAAAAGERHRTNNAAESLHSTLKRLIGRRRPNIRFFLHKLKVHHEAVRVRLRSTRIPSSRRSPKELQRCLITDRYLAGDMTLYELLESLGRINTFPNLSADGDMGDDTQ